MCYLFPNLRPQSIAKHEPDSVVLLVGADGSLAEVTSYLADVLGALKMNVYVKACSGVHVPGA